MEIFEKAIRHERNYYVDQVKKKAFMQLLPLILGGPGADTEIYSADEENFETDWKKF